MPGTDHPFPPDVQLDPDRPPRRLDAFFMRGFETLPIRWTAPGVGRRS